MTGTDDPLDGLEALFGGPATVDNPVDEAGAFTPTSDVLPVDEFPQFESWAAAEYLDPSGPFIPVEGEWAAAAAHVDDGYQRLGRTFDLTGVERRRGRDVRRAVRRSTTEVGYDHVIVEARTGRDRRLDDAARPERRARRTRCPGRVRGGLPTSTSTRSWRTT